MIRLEYDVTPADFEAFNLHIAYQPRLRAQRRRQAIAILIFFPIVVMTIGLLFPPPKGGPDLIWYLAAQLGFGLVVAVAMILFSHLAFRRRLRAQVRTMLGRNPRESFLGKQQLEVGPEGVTIDSPLLRATYRWPAVVGAEETEAHLFIMLGEVYGIIVPKRGQDAAALAALRSTVAASARASEQQGAGG
ncbi:YcxB family protein [Roseomonas hellenica]|uniref:YcxB family protein n=1 Tax=Plastoroseomonas hellenica TaxID=2687306 RepID=A0ABS5F2G7_9PROT|nr:YcxB family protein [Plastoroseomonas hellenica]MBR0666764.1 YcxB family protein [Plastoroseomonas hellenica]